MINTDGRWQCKPCAQADNQYHLAMVDTLCGSRISMLMAEVKDRADQTGFNVITKTGARFSASGGGDLEDLPERAYYHK